VPKYASRSDLEEAIKRKRAAPPKQESTITLWQLMRDRRSFMLTLQDDSLVSVYFNFSENDDLILIVHAAKIGLGERYLTGNTPGHRRKATMDPAQFLMITASLGGPKLCQPKN
jgi:hypothetical protein